MNSLYQFLHRPDPGIHPVTVAPVVTLPPVVPGGAPDNNAAFPQVPPIMFDRGSASAHLLGPGPSFFGAQQRNVIQHI